MFPNVRNELGECSVFIVNGNNGQNFKTSKLQNLTTQILERKIKKKSEQYYPLILIHVVFNDLENVARRL